MQSEFLRSMAKLGFPSLEAPILVAVSGGVDSMVLATLLFQCGYRMAVAHCNYGLRGNDSDGDEELVRTWCEDRGLQFHLKRIDTRKLTEESNSSVQMVARTERYSFFDKLMADHGYGAAVLAHHANDRVESLLLNLLRGTGFRGLQGMPAKRDQYIRPLLGFSKKDIRDFASENAVPYREDSSNVQTYYQRNWVRLKLLPLLQAANPKAFETLRAFSERVENERENYTNWVGLRLAEVGTEDEVSTERLIRSKAPFTLLKELLGPKGFSSDQVFELLGMLDSVSGTEVRSETHRVVKDRNRLLIAEIDSSVMEPELSFQLLDRAELKSLKTPIDTALLDAERVTQSDLKLRQWNQGDRFRPLGMKGWKLLSDFFIDEKLSVIEKEKVWLLTHKDEIVWVIGIRLDDRYKVTDATQKVLKVKRVA